MGWPSSLLGSRFLVELTCLNKLLYAREHRPLNWEGRDVPVELWCLCVKCPGHPAGIWFVFISDACWLGDRCAPHGHSR